MITATAAGAAGAALIIGQSNDSGTSQTVLTNAGFGAAFTLKTTNTATNATGIFGWSSNGGSGATRGVYGRADGPNSYGVYAVQNGASGTGSAIYADGNNNEGLVATSSDNSAIRGTATGCTGVSCGGNGVAGLGFGNAGGVFGDGSTSIAGIWASEGSIAAIYGTQTDAGAAAVEGTSPAGNGVVGLGENGNGVDQDCSGPSPCLPLAGGVFNGTYGVIGETDSALGVGVYANTTNVTGYALYANGLTHVEGNLTVSGTCTGCTAAINAINGSASTLKQGDAVAVDGVTQAKDGSIVLVVRAAKKGDIVLGVVDRELKAAAGSVKVGGVARMIKVNGGGDKKVTSAVSTLTAPKGGQWADGGTSVGANKYLRIITGGIFAFAGAAPASAAVGDAVAVSGTNGKLGKAAADAGAKAGKYLGKLKDGRVVLLVSPS